MSFMITMSQKELHRLELIQKIRDKRLSVVEAAERLDLSRSQVHRLLQAYDRDGPAGLVSRKRSRPSNRRHSEEFRNAALDLTYDAGRPDGARSFASVAWACRGVVPG